METLTPLEYHALLAVAEKPAHGYSIRDTVEAESGGRLTPGAGTLYRLLARLATRELLEVSDADPAAEDTHPGLPRKYYALTPAGREVLADEARRLRDAYATAKRRLRLADGVP